MNRRELCSTYVEMGAFSNPLNFSKQQLDFLTKAIKYYGVSLQSDASRSDIKNACIRVIESRPEFDTYGDENYYDY